LCNVELNPQSFENTYSVSTGIKRYCKEVAKESSLFQSLAAGVRKLTKGNKYYLELDPNKWTDEDFSAKNITGFWVEKLNKIPIVNAIIPFQRYFAKFVNPESTNIENLSQKDAAYVKFAYNATKNSREGKIVNNNYKLITHDKSQKDKNGFEVFVQRSENAKRTIISYKDTDDALDWESNIQLAKGEKPDQLEAALKIYREILEKYPNDEIIITGFSLGGSLTELVCSSPEAKSHGKTRGFSFNGYGADSNLSACGEGYSDLDNVICVSSSADIVVGNGSHHVGRDYIVPVEFDWEGFHRLTLMNDGIKSLKSDKQLFSELDNPKNRKNRKLASTNNLQEQTNSSSKLKQFAGKISNSFKRIFS
jgi:hypothetical protein